MNPFTEMLVQDSPCFHSQRDGGVCSWAGNINRLNDIEGIIQPGMNTVETGSGYSTVVFLASGCNHTTLTYDGREIDRIHLYCDTKSISTEKHCYLVGDSTETVKEVSGNFDLIFIDGAHRFPHPIIDWFYLNKMLNVGGITIIDDTDIMACHILSKFLLSDPGHELIKIQDNYTILKKIGNTPSPGDWPSQPFSAKKVADNQDVLSVLGLDGDTVIVQDNPELVEVYNSMSWKITAPLRKIHKLIFK